MRRRMAERIERQMMTSEVQYVGPLKVWTADHEEWCIATTAEEAGDAYEKGIGHRLGRDGEPAGANWPDAEWTEEPAGKVFRYTPDDGSTWIAKTCAEWAVTMPAGYFASANV